MPKQTPDNNIKKPARSNKTNKTKPSSSDQTNKPSPKLAKNKLNNKSIIEKEQKPEDEIKDDFVDLYTLDEDGKSVDMTTLERKSNTRNIIVGFVLTIFVLTAVAALLGYLVFGTHRASTNEGDISIEIEASQKIASGDELELIIKYKNDSQSDIVSGTIEMLLPQGFYFRSSDPQPRDASNNKWDLTNIAAGTEGTITISGQLVGQLDEQKDFTALLTYTPANFSSDFQQSAHVSIILDESIIKLETNVSEQARTGDSLQYVFKFTNTSSLPLVNVKAFVDYPNGFKATSANPTANKSDHTWVFDEVASNATEEIVIVGDVTAAGGTILNMVTQVGLQEPDGFFNIQTEANDEVLVVNPELALTLTAPEFAQAGETIKYVVDVENTSEVDINDVELLLDFTGKALESSEVSLDIIDTIGAGKKVTLEHTATVKAELTDDIKSIVATLKVVGASVDGAAVEFSQTAETTTALQGTVAIGAQARYFDDDLSKIGDGPIPPQVDIKTTYVIRWTVTASGGAMDDIILQTTLPAGITYEGSSDSRISHNAGQVTLELKSVAGGTSKYSDFKVSATPTKDDKNKLLILTNQSILTATDSQSSESVQVQANQVTSQLNTDPGSSDDGVVVGKSKSDT